jgi:phage tail-like protein
VTTTTSGRGAIEGLRSPHPIAATLPAMYQDDDLAQRFCDALDGVLAPVISTLDCLPSYLDPRLAPPDVLDWLAGWVGLPDAVAWPLDRRRALVARAAELHAWRGTAYAIRELVELATGIVPELEDSGGTNWSRDAMSRLPGRRRPELVVRVYAPEGEVPDVTLLTRLVALVAPAHLPWQVEVTSLG